MADKKEQEKGGTYVIKPPSIGLIEVPIIGIEPLLVHAWSAKARIKMLAGQQKEAGTKAKTTREKRNPQEDYEGARYVFRDPKKKIE